jgi:exodeoxyribonuclease VII large subunit
MQNTNNNKPKLLSVSQLNRQVKRLLEGNFPSVWVEGELSNFSRPSSGHWYFTLKDNGAQIRCAMFRGANSRLRFEPEVGQQITLRAKLSLYEARGDYQLIAEHMELSGTGALAKAFEELKAKLNAEGLFDSEVKQELPELPKHIAVITSATGAAFQDILTVLGRRFPSIPVTLIPVAVQGDAAAGEIAHAIALANALADDGSFDFDVILMGRGGGSMEDLWAFNEELVARSIFASDLPIVSAVGHEVDFTIADFVADARAATPSAGAEMLSPDRQEWLNTFAGYAEYFAKHTLRQLRDCRQQLDWTASRLKHPGERIQDHSQRLDELELRLHNGWRNQLQHQKNALKIAASNLQQCTPSHQLSNYKTQTANLWQRLTHSTQHYLKTKQQTLQTTMQLLHTVSPLQTLDRGYAIVSDENNQLVRDMQQLEIGQKISTRLANGKIISTVDEIKAS